MRINKKSSRRLKKIRSRNHKGIIQEHFPEQKDIVPDGKVSLSPQHGGGKENSTKAGLPEVSEHWGQKEGPKSFQREHNGSHKGSGMASHFPTASLDARRQWSKAFNTLKANDLQP